MDRAADGFASGGIAPAPGGSDHRPRCCQLELDVACFLAATEAIRETADPHSFAALRSIVATACIPIAHAGPFLGGHRIGPGARPDLVRAVVERSGSVDRKAVTMDAPGLGVSMELVACEPTWLPFRLTGIRERVVTATRMDAEIKPFGSRSVRSRS